MRILQVNSLFSGGGVDNQTLELSAGLRDLGDDVSLAVAAGSRWEPRARELGVRVETNSGRGAGKITMVRSWAKLIRTNRIQIVHAHQGRDYWPAILAANLAGIGTQVVVTRHLMTRPRALSRALLLRATSVVAVSAAVESVLRAHLRGSPARIHRIDCGLDFSRFLPSRTPEVWNYRDRIGWPADSVAFAVVGSFHPPAGKGQLDFLEAAANLKRVFPQARFAILGYGEMEARLKERIASLGLAQVAQVLPFHNEIPKFMSALDILVLPTTAPEALGLVLLEALASHRPVIASKKDGIPECFTDGEHGILFPPGDVRALTEAMRTLLVDPALRERYGNAGSAHVQTKFSREQLALRTHNLYASLSRPDAKRRPLPRAART
jgi:glycosyltransferase involved in cell wall biosynthesis